MKNFNQIKLIIFDCDGVLTDGHIIYTGQGAETKTFSATDGLGITLLPLAGIKSAVITGRKSDVLKKRCDELRINYLFQGVRNKVAITSDLLTNLALSWDNIAFMGDDWNDYELLLKAYITGVPDNAFPEIKKIADFIAARSGGNGAVREFIEYILKNQGIFEQVINCFIKNLSSASKENRVSL
jgi:3-deoxy-D-manno-octulosonate 8-phosphate phosphatase (KDO 8-P phosphatase)